MSNSTKTIRPFKTDARVRWNPTMRPTGAPDMEGRVFMSTRRETYVYWDGSARVQCVFTGAIVPA